jgi:hypothetical protein
VSTTSIIGFAVAAVLLVLYMLRRRSRIGRED